MDFLERLAGADVFWSTAALVQVALMIALALEGRTAQEDFERLYEQTRRWHALMAVRDKTTELDLHRLIATQPDTSLAGKRATDVQITVVAVAALAAGTVIALLPLLPATNAGPVWTGLALAVEAISIVGGLVALITLLARRAAFWQIKAGGQLEPTLEELLAGGRE